MDRLTGYHPAPRVLLANIKWEKLCLPYLFDSTTILPIYISMMYSINGI